MQKKYQKMINFDSYVKIVLSTLKVCGVPVMAMRGVCDDNNLFPGADLDGSAYISIADGYTSALGHGDMCIFKGDNGEAKGVLLVNVSAQFLSIIRGNGLLYGTRYKSVKNTFSNEYVVHF